MPDLGLRVVGDDEYVSQYESRRSGPDAFRDRPGPHDRGGRRSMTASGGAWWPLSGAAGFAVSHAPTKRNPDHAQVSLGALRRVERCGCG